MSAFSCPRCGRGLARKRSGAPLGTLKIRCPRCRFLMFDYPRPCAGMLVVKDESLLMLRRGHRPKRGWLDLPGGFMEAGEDPEAAARRELLEETGLTVGPARGLGIYWDRYFLGGYGYFPTMNFYHLARWRSGEPRAADDAAAAEWMPIAGLPRRRSRFAWPHMERVIRDLGRVLRARG